MNLNQMQGCQTHSKSYEELPSLDPALEAPHRPDQPWACGRGRTSTDKQGSVNTALPSVAGQQVNVNWGLGAPASATGQTCSSLMKLVVCNSTILLCTRTCIQNYLQYRGNSSPTAFATVWGFTCCFVAIPGSSCGSHPHCLQWYQYFPNTLQPQEDCHKKCCGYKAAYKPF